MRIWLKVLLFNMSIILLYVIIIGAFNYDFVLLNIILPFILYGMVSVIFYKMDKIIWSFPIKTGIIYLIATVTFTIIMCLAFFADGGSISSPVSIDANFLGCYHLLIINYHNSSAQISSLLS